MTEMGWWMNRFLRDGRGRNSEHKFGDLGLGRRTFSHCNRKKREGKIGCNWLSKADFSISVGDPMCWSLSNNQNAEKRCVGKAGEPWALQQGREARKRGVIPGVAAAQTHSRKDVWSNLYVAASTGCCITGFILILSPEQETAQGMFSSVV